MQTVRKPPRLTAITTCKGRLHHLKQTLPLLADQPEIEIVVVDYGCPQGSAAWVEENHPDVKIIKVTDDPGFHLARARNIGANIATTPWLLFIDADVKAEAMQNWINNQLKADEFYLTRNYGADLTGSFFCPRSIFELVGGYDEAIRDWGGADEDIYLRLIRSGQTQKNYPDELFSALLHGEDERFTYCKESNRDKQMLLSYWYASMKYDLMAVWGRDLSLAERMQIRKLANEASVHAMSGINGANKTELSITLGESTDMMRSTNWVIERRMVYSFSARNPADSGSGTN